MFKNKAFGVFLAVSIVGLSIYQIAHSATLGLVFLLVYIVLGLGSIVWAGKSLKI